MQRLRTALWDVSLLRYLQHLTELTIAYDKKKPFGKKNPLPQTLRTLRLRDSTDLILRPDTLPPRLTTLSLGVVHAPLPAGALPQTLMSLHLRRGFDAASPIGEDMLPAGLNCLRVDEWTLPLSHIKLPASLTELHIDRLTSRRWPALPARLQTLCVGDDFNLSLDGYLPTSLRILRLTNAFDQPLTASLFASIPQLEELWLSDNSPECQLAAHVLPRSLRVLRVGKRCTLTVWEASGELPELAS